MIIHGHRVSIAVTDRRQSWLYFLCKSDSLFVLSNYLHEMGKKWRGICQNVNSDFAKTAIRIEDRFFLR